MTVEVFIASSLDGFIAGPNDELDWLEHTTQTEDTFTPFFDRVGAMLMGRRTWDVLSKFDAWHYGDTPILVATRRPLETDKTSVRAVRGDIEAMVSEARAVAGDACVYLDGGAIIRAALDAGLIDEMTVTMIPYILGDGIPLFAGSSEGHRLELLEARPIGGGLVQLRYRALE